MKLGRVSLLGWILIGFVLGAVVGLAVGPPIRAIKPLGDLLVRLLLFIVVPIVFFTLSVATAGVTGAKFGRMFSKTVLFYYGTAIAGLIIAFLVVLPTGISMPLPPEVKAMEVREPPPLTTVLLEIVPTNPVAALAEAKWLQIIFTAILVGVAIGAVGKPAEPLLHLLTAARDVTFRLVGWLLYYAPIGVFALIAWTVGVLGPRVLLPYLGLIGLVYLACVLHLLITYSGLLRFYAGLSPREFYRAVITAPLFAFSTASSGATLPVTLSVLKDKVKMPDTYAGFVAPLGATVNMDGTAMYQAIAAVFLANTFGVAVTPAVAVTIVLTAILASIGTAGVPGAGLIMLGMVLGAIGVPAGAGMALILGIDRILDMARTAVNVFDDLVCAAVIAHSEGEKLSSDLYVGRVG
jgi:Na+/H+-dicarboxylate symporter